MQPSPLNLFLNKATCIQTGSQEQLSSHSRLEIQLYKITLIYKSEKEKDTQTMIKVLSDPLVPLQSSTQY